MIRITKIQDVNEFEKIITLTDGRLTQAFNIYYHPEPFPSLTYDQAFAYQFDHRPMLTKLLREAITKAFVLKGEMDCSIVIDGELDEIGDQLGKGPNWMWYKELSPEERIRLGERIKPFMK